MWNDIDLYHAFRDFTSDPVSFPGDEMRAFIQELVSCVLPSTEFFLRHRLRLQITSTASVVSTYFDTTY